MASRGTDPETERRRLRSSEDDDPIDRVLEGVFYASVETLTFGLPTLVGAMLLGDVEVTFVVSVAVAAFCLVGGATRIRWLAAGRTWPPVVHPSLALFRVGYYNAALVASVATGLGLVTDRAVRFAWASDPVVGPAAVAGAGVAVSAWAFPRVAAALG